MNVAQVVDHLKSDAQFSQNLTLWKTIPDRPARFGGFPDRLDDRLAKAFQSRGIHDLYSHQSAAIDAVLDGKNTCIVTPTASGKTLCYNVLTDFLDNFF